MRILHINSRFSSGGAARAARRLFEGTLKICPETYFLASDSDTTQQNVVGVRLPPGRKILPRIYRRFERYYQELFNPEVFFHFDFFPDYLLPTILYNDPDIIHLHWIADTFLPVSSFNKFNKPIVWTIHDMAAFTGGCHYSSSCEGYISGCNGCPIIENKFGKKFVRYLSKSKKKKYLNTNLSIVAPSVWLADCARKSSMDFSSVECIPNGIDTELYRPFSKSFAREVFNLPKNKTLLMFSAEKVFSKRKGLHLLLDALKLGIDKKKFDLELMLMGQTNEVLQDLDIKSYQHELREEKLISLYYSSADLFVAPSLEENLANTVMEALSCGIPVVAFNIGGMPDMIEHKCNGYLADPYNVVDLANGISWCLENKERYHRLSQRAREKVIEDFSITDVVQRYYSLYSNLVNG